MLDSTTFSSTTIPLAKIGESTGIDYKWNSSDKQVEITTK
ncbi:hypothetical protein JOC58_003857 [Paenibacillus hunanensis]|uniref:Copper amine oxidase-like N-terminal domain-containing protein n=1 Tax=Paenibacillus hunanensis TaxID=539262 RepID=A0ABU1J411_9BACL|nr:hypothetical protein [Paenibacillus hunanensis]